MDSEVIFVSTSTYQVDRSGARARDPRMPTSRVASLGQEKTWPKVKKARARASEIHSICRYSSVATQE